MKFLFYRFGEGKAAFLFQHDPNSDTPLWIEKDNFITGLREQGPAILEKNLESLTKALVDEHPFIRQNAAWAFYEMGEGAKKAKKELLEALHDEDHTVAEVAVWTLCKGFLDDEAVLKTLQNASRELSEPKVRYTIIESLGKAPAGQKSVLLPFLEACLADKDENIRYSALVALGIMKGQAADLWEKIVSLSGDGSQEVRKMRLRALWEVGGDTPKTAEELFKAFDDEDIEVVFQAFSLLRVAQKAGSDALKEKSEGLLGKLTKLPDLEPALRSMIEEEVRAYQQGKIS